MSTTYGSEQHTEPKPGVSISNQNLSLLSNQPPAAAAAAAADAAADISDPDWFEYSESEWFEYACFLAVLPTRLRVTKAARSSHVTSEPARLARPTSRSMTCTRAICTCVKAFRAICCSVLIFRPSGACNRQNKTRWYKWNPMGKRFATYLPNKKFVVFLLLPSAFRYPAPP